MPELPEPLLKILPSQVVLEVIPPGGQVSIAKLLKLISKVVHIKKHWDKLKNFLIDIALKNAYKKLRQGSDECLVVKQINFMSHYYR
jgi:hypothetical protein